MEIRTDERVSVSDEVWNRGTGGKEMRGEEEQQKEKQEELVIEEWKQVGIRAATHGIVVSETVVWSTLCSCGPYSV